MDLNSRIEQWKKSKQSSGFILDFDGTLSSIVADPTAAAIVPEAIEILKALSAEYRLVAIVSGRQVMDVWDKVQLSGIRYFGVYGAQEWRDGQQLERSSDSKRWREAAEELATAAVSLFEQEQLIGCTAELKGEAVSLHFRNALEPGVGDRLLRWAQDSASGAGFVATMGRKVIDVKSVGVSKALAVVSLVKELDLERVLVAGDDTTDVEAMKVAGDLLGRNALRIGVRSPEEPPGLVAESDHTVTSSREMVELLERFV